MLVKPTLDELLPRTENRYTLAILVAKRARQLITGGQPMVESETPNMVTLSCEEVAAGGVVAIKGERRQTDGTKEANEDESPRGTAASGQSPVLVPLRPDILEERRRAAAQSEEQQLLEVMHDGQVLPVDPDEAAARNEIDMDRFNDEFDAASEAYVEENDTEALDEGAGEARDEASSDTAADADSFTGGGLAADNSADDLGTDDSDVNSADETQEDS